MISAFSATYIGTAILAAATHPATLMWASGWVAAALGVWLRAALPPTEHDADLTIAMASSCM